MLSHWARAADEGKPYPFAKFNKGLDTPTYTEEEYTVSEIDQYIVKDVPRTL